MRIGDLVQSTAMQDSPVWEVTDVFQAHTNGLSEHGLGTTFASLKLRWANGWAAKPIETRTTRISQLEVANEMLVVALAIKDCDDQANSTARSFV